MNPVNIKNGSSPLILAMPHSGTFVPKDVWEKLTPAGQTLADTDWYIDKLYDELAPQASIIRANFHRYVIDANRDPHGRSLYSGQNTTGLCPGITFGDEQLYRDGGEPDDTEIAQRLKDFHRPYHAAIEAAIDHALTIHGIAILYDCHSIQSHVPFLFDGRLPDFNIGTFNGRSCAQVFEDSVSNICQSAEGFTSVTNGRFKGGWTTRHYGRPQDNIHAVQMEIAQINYMDENPLFTYESQRAAQLRPHLRLILNALETAALSHSGKATS